MNDILVRIGLSVLVVTPCFLSILAIALLNDRDASFSRAIQRLPLLRKASRQAPDAPAQTTPEEPRRLSSYTSLWIAGVVQTVGLALIGTTWEPLGAVLTVYPSSAIFYVLPRELTDHVPEAAAFFLGTTTAVCITTLVVHATRVGFQRVVEGTSAA